ncbi:MAG: VanZ family protein [bacterium]
MKIKPIKKIWKIILIYIFFIYISLPYFPVFVSFLKNYISKDTLNISSLLFCVSFFLILSKWIYDKQYKFAQYILIISPLLLLTYMSFSLDVWAERVHLIQYGLLGLLVSWANKISSLNMLLASGLFIMSVGLVDEIIQWYLPNRYGDIRDVVMNSLGGLSGLWLGQFLYWENNYLKNIFVKNK